MRRVITGEEPVSLYRTVGPRAAEIPRHDTRLAGKSLPRTRTDLADVGCDRGVSLLKRTRLDPEDTGLRATAKTGMCFGDSEMIPAFFVTIPCRNGGKERGRCFMWFVCTCHLYHYVC